MIQRGQPFYTDREYAQLERLRENHRLYTGQHHLVYADDVPPAGDGKSRIYIIANFLRLVSEIQAELLFGSNLTVRSPTGNEAHQAALDLIVTENDLQRVAMEAEITRSWAGTAWLRCGYDELEEGSGQYLPTIESLDPLTVFPRWSKKNGHRLAAVEIKVVVEGEDGRLYGRVQRHLPGVIEEELYELSERDRRVLSRVPLSRLFGVDAPPERLETGIPHLLVVPVTGIRAAGQPLGESDYDVSLRALQAEINARLTAISRVLDRHTDPKLLLSQELFDMLMDPNGNISARDLQVIGLPPGEQVTPQYLVWDASLSQAFEQLKTAIDLLLTLSRTSPVAAGLDREGIPDSGRALRLRLLQSLSKRQTQARYWRDALLQVLWLAQLIHTHPLWGGERSYEPADPLIEFGPPVAVRDDVEAAQVAQVHRSVGVSLQTVIEELHPDWTADRVQEEMRRIEAEQGVPLTEPDPTISDFRARLEALSAGGDAPEYAGEDE